ncbi:MAG: OsmC family protein [Alphaproteobacteria bacterium]|jgi:organic hydroperoxide reductase OsmC/OhrA|nr:OsmC family protein [Alphaproteobacteria bacterium]
MAEHKIRLTWNDGGKPFTYEAYPREHQIAFKDGQDRMTASASPAYRGDGRHGDPEDLLVAALSSCHMLSLLAICTKKKVTVQSYEDDAVGFLENDGGKLWITRVILRPRVVCDADAATLEHIHHLAHEACFIANSVKTTVTVEPR